MTNKLEVNEKSFCVTVNNEILYKLDVFDDGGDIYPFYIENIPYHVMKVICDFYPYDFPDGINLNGDYKANNPRILDWIDITKHNNVTTLIIPVGIELIKWSQPFTVLDFIDVYKENLKPYNHDLDIESAEDGWAYLQVKHITNPVKAINETYQLVRLQIEKIYEQSIVQLNKKIKDKILIKIFEFPEEYRTICSQYLIWFGEFLENLGIHALVSTENEETKTKLIISSEGSQDVRDEIEKLFYSYLSLPYSEYLPEKTRDISLEHKFFISHLNSQIDNFKTQIDMKNAIIEMKNTHIQNLQNTVDMQNKQFLLLDCISDDDSLSLFNGVLVIKDIEWGPFKISAKKLLTSINDITKK